MRYRLRIPDLFSTEIEPYSLELDLGNKLNISQVIIL